MKKIIAVITTLALSLAAFTQSLSLDSCQAKARANYPLIKQFELIQKTSEYNLSNAGKSNLPQIVLSGKATYQSAVTSLPITIPGVTIPSLSKDQYQISVDVSQNLWDGGLSTATKKTITAQTETEKQKVEVELYAIVERVNQIYFGILMLNEQLKQNAILNDELSTNYNRIESLKNNGLATETDLNLIRVEQLNNKQRHTELEITRKSYVEMLGILTGTIIAESTIVEYPETPKIDLDWKTNRPEIQLMEAQKLSIESQRQLITASSMPKFGIFVQGGYGKPTLNMLSNAFDTYYIGGLRMSWNFSNLYSQKNNFNKLELNKKIIDNQREVFLLNNDLKNKQNIHEIEKLQSALRNDDEIIMLRTKIKDATEVKTENGTATVTDLLRELNAENIAIQTRLIHNIQLQLAIYQYKFNTNN